MTAGSVNPEHLTLALLELDDQSNGARRILAPLGYSIDRLKRLVQPLAKFSSATASRKRSARATSSLSETVELTALPQENGRWVCRASTTVSSSEVVEYGATGEGAITSALRRLADLIGEKDEQ